MATTRIRISTPVDQVPGTSLIEAVDRAGRTLPGPRLAVVGMIHGNEPVGGMVLDRFAEAAVSELVSGSVLMVRANLEGAAAGLRHTPDGLDMNRLWDRDTLERLTRRPGTIKCYEERRVLELAPLLVQCDAILDLHSTSRPAAPFLVFRDDQRHGALARKLGVRNLVTGLYENDILPGGICANAGLRVGERSTRLGFTFEAGQHLAPDNVERAWWVAVRLLHELGMWRTQPPPLDPDFEVYEVVERFVQAAADEEQYRFVGFEGGEPGSGRKGPPRQLHSFENIEADEVIVRQGRDGLVRAQTPFTMLMPAPTTPPGTDLYFTALPRHGGLGEGRALSDQDARREAMAIERMFDLTADDDFVRGTSWVSFDARQLLDLCASLVGRAQRLPVGHPHRKITVVGRGDNGGGEREARHGQRYRSAMRGAIASGVPVERIQLMRGAPLGWLDAMTSHGMLDTLRRRAKEHPEAPPLGLRVSVRQPHTVSLLVAGDLDLALSTGDFRYVRVALLVEAASVEPEGDGAKVRVVRAGMVSARPEVLQASNGLLRALREEHDHVVVHGALAHLPEIKPLLEGTLIAARPDPELLASLHNVLYRLQLRLWVDSLRPELTEPVRLRTPDAVGRWLAVTMAAAGIYDVEALRALVIRPTGKAWVADPRQLDRVSKALDGDDKDLLDGTGALPVRVSPPRRPLPRQPLMASDVTADDLERWIGWKRYVRGVHVVPDHRGKDVDLAFAERVIRARIARWFRDAREQAAAAPGNVLVVVAGDGLNPQRDDLGDAIELLDAHRDLLRDPNVHYLRIQHAQGTHLSWFKDFLFTLQQRPAGQSVALQWEAEHGSTVNVVMLATRDEGAEARAWSLDGWTIRACAVVLSDLEGMGARDYKLGMFTSASDTQGLSQELVHFGRAHCTGLLKQAGWRIRDPRGAPSAWELERGMVTQIARWIERVRGWRGALSVTDDDAKERVARLLGISDLRLARALVDEVEADLPVEAAARALWASVPPWPGPETPRG